MSEENTPPTADTPLMSGAPTEPCPPGAMAENNPEPPPYEPPTEADLPGVSYYNPTGGQQMYPTAGPKNYPPGGLQNYPPGGLQNYPPGGLQNYPAGGPQNYSAGRPQNYPAGGPQNYSAGGPQNYPAGGSQNHLAVGPPMCLMGAPQTTVIMAPPMQSTILMGAQLKDTPAVTTCPYCLQTITTRVSYTAGLLAWAICGLIFLFGFWLGCCLIPFCIDGCKDVDHSCPTCNNHIYTHKRIG